MIQWLKVTFSGMIQDAKKEGSGERAEETFGTRNGISCQDLSTRQDSLKDSCPQQTDLIYSPLWDPL